MDTSVMELCESRDSEYTNLLELNESCKLIEFLCTIINYFIYLLRMYVLGLYLNVLLSLAIFIHSAFICYSINAADIHWILDFK